MRNTFLIVVVQKSVKDVVDLSSTLNSHVSCIPSRSPYIANRILYDNSQNWHEDATSDCGACGPDGHEEVDYKCRETDVEVEEVVRVS